MVALPNNASDQNTSTWDIPYETAFVTYDPLFLTEKMLGQHPNLTIELSMRTFENHPRSPLSFSSAFSCEDASSVKSNLKAIYRFYSLSSSPRYWAKEPRDFVFPSEASDPL